VLFEQLLRDDEPDERNVDANRTMSGRQRREETAGAAADFEQRTAGGDDRREPVIDLTP
jgi:hypothetical protein